MYGLSLLLFAVFSVTVVLTWLARAYALSRKLLDVPNERSSHTVSTPRGGGVAIVAVMLAVVSVLWVEGMQDAKVLGGFGGGGLLVAAVGFADDHFHVPAAWRLLAHGVAAALMIAAVGAFPALWAFGFEWKAGSLITAVLMALLVVWLSNVFNFMDGIDGIASVQAVTVSTAAATLLWYGGATDVAVLSGALAAVSLGFLVWNWPPAKIFMGDVGSGFLGFSFGALAAMAFAVSALFFWVWLILLGVFLVDATVTLFRRVVRHETFYVAHRSHAYQYASRKMRSHLPVTVAVGMINVLWLLPLAALVASRRLDGAVALLVAYIPLLGLALYFKAGARELQDV